MNKISKLKLVIDTNVMLVAISKKSQYHWIIESLENNRFDLYISTEILLEYEEIIQSRYNKNVVKYFLACLIRYQMFIKQMFISIGD